MMNKIPSLCYKLLGFVILGWLLAGCGQGARLTCPEPGEELVNPEPGGELVTLTLQNDTCMSICVLLISPDRCEYMGGVNYVEENPLRSGETLTVGLPPGKYATWVELCTEEYKADEHLKVYSDTTHTIVDPKLGIKSTCGASLTIINNADVPICKMYIGIGESVYTGWNWLGSEHIQPGGTQTLTLRPDLYFIRAEACDGAWLRSEVDVQISGNQTWTVP